MAGTSTVAHSFSLMTGILLGPGEDDVGTHCIASLMSYTVKSIPTVIVSVFFYGPENFLGSVFILLSLVFSSSFRIAFQVIVPFHKAL